MAARVAICFVAILLGACQGRPAPSPRAFLAASSPASSVPNWYIDGGNSSGCASDNNTCQSATCSTSGAGPCATFAAIVGRWGTTGPILTTNTTITFLSDQQPSDWIYFEPKRQGASNGASEPFVNMVGQPTVFASGTISGWVAPNRSAGTLGQMTLPAGSTRGMLVVNSTRGNSRAWAYQNTVGTTWNVTATMTPATVPTGDGGTPGIVTTWANGDSIQLWTLPHILVRHMSAGPWSSFLYAPLSTMYVSNVTVGSPNSGPWGAADVNDSVQFVEDYIAEEVAVTSAAQQAIRNMRVRFTDSFSSGIVSGMPAYMKGPSLAAPYTSATTTGSADVWGGAMAGLVSEQAVLSGFFIGGDAALSGLPTLADGGVGCLTGESIEGHVTMHDGVLGSVFVDQCTALDVDGIVSGVSSQNGGTFMIWGPGALNVHGRFVYPKGSAVADILMRGGAWLDNGQTGCSMVGPFDGGAAMSLFCGVPLSASALDACPASSANFCGLAFVQGGPSITGQ